MGGKEIENLKVFNQIGQILIEKEQPNSNTIFHNLTSGVYEIIIHVKEGGVFTKKLLVQ